jgi:hypothetical protein
LQNALVGRSQPLEKSGGWLLYLEKPMTTYHVTVVISQDGDPSKTKEITVKLAMSTNLSRFLDELGQNGFLYWLHDNRAEYYPPHRIRKARVVKEEDGNAG